MVLGKFKALSRGKAKQGGTLAVPHWRGRGGGLEPKSSPDYTETPVSGQTNKQMAVASLNWIDWFCWHCWVCHQKESVVLGESLVLKLISAENGFLSTTKFDSAHDATPTATSK